MAELSAETKAIIDRLKAEGNLIRNSGTNSIRSVKIQLDRFEGVFNTISANVVEQTKILQMQAGLAQEAVEAQRTREQLDELKQEEEKSRTDDDDSRRKTDENINNIGDSISRALSLKNLALAGAGLFVGYNLLKGFIDERTDGGFTRMEEGIKNFDFSSLGTLPETFNRLQETMESLSTTIATLPETLGNLNTTLQNLGTSLASLTESLNGLGPLADRILESIREIAEAWWWKAILVAGAGLAAALINARARVGRMPPIPGGGPGAGPGGRGRGGFLGRLGGMLGRVGIGRLGLAGLGAYSIYQMDAENRAAFEEGGAPAVRDLQERRQNNMMDTFESTPILSQLISGYNSLYEFVHGEPAPRTSFDAERRDQDQARIDAYREYGQSRAEGERLAREAAEQARIDALSESEYNAEAIQGEIQDLQDEILRLNQMMGGQGTEHPQVGILRGQIEDLQAELERNTSTPELTFEDFGVGTPRGRGSIVETNGERQRYLEGAALDALIEAQRLANERDAAIESDMSEIERYLRSLEENAGGGSGGAVVINAPTNVSPVFNNVEGGKSVNQVSIRGGGGMPSLSSNPYGLPGLAN